jgi:hypothetical protein
MMPSPADFYAPRIDYGAGVQAGQEVGNALAAAPDEYWQAQQRKPFVDAQGNVITDPQKLGQEILRRGGLPAAQQLYPFLWKQQLLGQSGLFGEPSASAPSAQPPMPTRPQQAAPFPATGPSGITGEFTSPQPSADVSGGTGGAPAPVQGAPETAQPSAGIQPYAPGSIPPDIQRDLLRADGLTKQAARIAIVDANAARPFEDEARQLRESANKRLEQLFGSRLPTEMQRNLTSGATATTEVLKGTIDRSNKTYEGMRGTATTYQTELKPSLSVAKSILNNPAFYSGTGGQWSLDWNKIKSVYGNQNAAQLQEAFSKVTASTLLQQSNELKLEMLQAGGQAGRIFAQQVELMQRAAPQLQTTPAGNRTLIEYQTRLGDLHTERFRLATEYLRTHQYLDVGFDRQMERYLQAHPLFTQQELAHIELLGAPTIPSDLANNQQGFQTWARGMGLHPGDAYRGTDGTYRKAP